MSNFDDVREMYERYGFDLPSEPRLLSTEREGEDETSAFNFRLSFMQEELAEFHFAHTRGDLAGAADALIDLVVVAMGTAAMMGLPWRELWDDVQRANMSKVPGRTRRGVGFDLIKPAGWEGPKTEEILRRRGIEL